MPFDLQVIERARYRSTRELPELPETDEPSDDANASTNLGTSFVRLLAETRRAMPAPNPARRDRRQPPPHCGGGHSML